MRLSGPWQHPLTRWILEHLEIVMAVVTAVVSIAVALIVTDADGDAWLVAALTSIVLGFLNGFLFSAARRRRLRSRAETIGEIRVMLRDQVVSPLSSISLNAQMSQTIEGRRRERIINSVDKIDDMLETLSPESYRDWYHHYRADEGEREEARADGG